MEEGAGGPEEEGEGEEGAEAGAEAGAEDEDAFAQFSGQASKKRARPSRPVDIDAFSRPAPKPLSEPKVVNYGSGAPSVKDEQRRKELENYIKTSANDVGDGPALSYGAEAEAKAEAGTEAEGGVNKRPKLEELEAPLSLSSASTDAADNGDGPGSASSSSSSTSSSSSSGTEAVTAAVTGAVTGAVAGSPKATSQARPSLADLIKAKGKGAASTSDPAAPSPAAAAAPAAASGAFFAAAAALPSIGGGGLKGGSADAPARLISTSASALFLVSKFSKAFPLKTLSFTAVCSDRRILGLLPSDVQMTGKVKVLEAQNHISGSIASGKKTVYPVRISAHGLLGPGSGYAQFCS